jgi:protein phosphatase
MADLYFGYKTEKGNVRERNEDCISLIPKEGIFAVFDGVGGESSGEIASRTAANALQTFIEENPLSGSMTKTEIEGYFSNCVNSMNAQIFEMEKNNPSTTGMATTAVIAFLDSKDFLHIINIGDSRAYILTEDDKELIQVTEDHTWVNLMLKEGQLTREEAEVHPDRNHITKALGASDYITPDFFHIPYTGQRTLLCTDGLTGDLDIDNLKGVLASDKDLQVLADELIDAALEANSTDNITVIVFER